MAINDNSEKQPLGNRIRDFLAPAFADARRNEIEFGILDSVFSEFAIQIPQLMEKSLKKIFNEAAMYSDTPEIANEFIINQLTQVDPRSGEPLYGPMKRFQLPVFVGFTNFTAQDVKEMPGYIKLHEMAREEDFAIKIIGLTPDEAKNPSGVPHLPMLIIDATKTYTEGAMENSNLYPNLPPQKVAFNPKKPQDHSF